MHTPKQSAKAPLFAETFLKDFLKNYSSDELELIQKDRDAVLEYSFFKKLPATDKPTYLATAGGPGACKSTVLESYLRSNAQLSNYVYTDPDQVALRKMNFTYGDSRTCFNFAESKSYHEALKIAYEKWRWASNYVAHAVLQEAFLHDYNIAHGTTSTSPHIVTLYTKLKPTYNIELLLCYAADQTRFETVQRREREQAFVQADPRDVITKGKEFSLRFPIYFHFADKITFYWQNALQNGQLPKPAATWERSTNQVVVHHADDWAEFCKQYHADLKVGGNPVPEELVQFFGKIDANVSEREQSSNNASSSTLPAFQASIGSTTIGQSTATIVTTTTKFSSVS